MGASVHRANEGQQYARVNIALAMPYWPLGPDAPSQSQLPWRWAAPSLFAVDLSRVARRQKISPPGQDIHSWASTIIFGSADGNAALFPAIASDTREMPFQPCDSTDLRAPLVLHFIRLAWPSRSAAQRLGDHLSLGSRPMPQLPHDLFLATPLGGLDPAVWDCHPRKHVGLPWWQPLGVLLPTPPSSPARSTTRVSRTLLFHGSRSSRHALHA